MTDKRERSRRRGASANAMLSLTEPGHFVLGCNYWASHAGTAMWSDWRPDVVRRDLARLARAGLQVLRVFPLWPDFQPLSALETCHGKFVEMRHGEEPLADDEAGQAGVSAQAMDRFEAFADMASRHGLMLIVGLITGWMSGRLFVPPALLGRNVMKDAAALQWQLRFVRHFVRRFRGHSAVLAWDLGNECNCMAPVSAEEAWVWTAAIVNAIRAQDATRPVVSGMHSLGPGRNAQWRMQDQGELTDVLTTHPYPYFTPFCDQDPVNTIRTELHSAAESRYYADLGGKPCLVEELGTLGPMVSSERVAAEFLRAAMFSAWANDCHGVLWWCAFDLGHLAHAPYDWDAWERELGLLRADGAPKPAMREMTRFRRVLDGLPVRALPPRLTEAVCVLSEGQDTWAAAYASFVLAKQAGFDLSFQYAAQPLRESSLYLLPCVTGGRAIPRRRWLELLARVQAGATLYVSHGNGVLSPLVEPFGIEVRTRSRRGEPARWTMEAGDADARFTTAGPIRLELAPTRARVLGREQDGNPVFTCARYGRGRIYFLSLPLETGLSASPGAFHSESAEPFWRVYAEVARGATARRALIRTAANVAVTEHPLDARRRVVVAINHGPNPVTCAAVLRGRWRLASAWYGQVRAAPPSGLELAIRANDAAVFVLRRGPARNVRLSREIRSPWPHNSDKGRPGGDAEPYHAEIKRCVKIHSGRAHRPGGPLSLS